MALPSSGPITMSMINTELAYPATQIISLNDAAVRALAQVPSGVISLSNFYGKSNAATKGFFAGHYAQPPNAVSTASTNHVYNFATDTLTDLGSSAPAWTTSSAIFTSAQKHHSAAGSTRTGGPTNFVNQQATRVFDFVTEAVTANIVNYPANIRNNLMPSSTPTTGYAFCSQSWINPMQGPNARYTEVTTFSFSTSTYGSLSAFPIAATGGPSSTTRDDVEAYIRALDWPPAIPAPTRYAHTFNFSTQAYTIHPIASAAGAAIGTLAPFKPVSSNTASYSFQTSPPTASPARAFKVVFSTRASTTLPFASPGASTACIVGNNTRAEGFFGSFPRPVPAPGNSYNAVRTSFAFSTETYTRKSDLTHPGGFPSTTPNAGGCSSPLALTLNRI